MYIGKIKNPIDFQVDLMALYPLVAPPPTKNQPPI